MAGAMMTDAAPSSLRLVLNVGGVRFETTRQVRPPARSACAASRPLAQPPLPRRRRPPPPSSAPPRRLKTAAHFLQTIEKSLMLIGLVDTVSEGRSGLGLGLGLADAHRTGRHGEGRPQCLQPNPPPASPTTQPLRPA